MDDQPLRGRAIGITADRRWEEQAELFRKRGAEVVHGPTMKTVDLRGDARLRAATEAVVSTPPTLLVATTGLGMRMWLEAAEAWGCRADLVAALSASTVVARGAKAASAARGAGIAVSRKAATEAMDEVVDHVAALPAGVRRRVAVQLFEPGGHPSTAALAGLAGDLVEVPLYQWALPDHPDPAARLIERIVDRSVDAVTFTSQPAVRHLFHIADGRGARDDVRTAFDSDVVAACIGPVCAEAARDEGVTKVVWPEPNRLVAMVKQVTELLASR